MSGTLFVVATPIGNLEDITLRALRILREADIIAAEDTRRTARLLAHHAIATPTVSFHEHNLRTRLPHLLKRLKEGEKVALVTDAGTPGISDPGVELVAACVEAGIAIDPIPGASASLAAGIASGFPLSPFTILGFPPHRSKTRNNWLADICELTGTVCFFEAPHRIVATLDALAQYSGNRPIMVGRELTKVHQQFLRGTARELLLELREPRGEFTVVMGPAEKKELTAAAHVDEDELAREFGQYTESSGASRREVISSLARKYGRSSREIYSAIERAKKPQ